ncbi:hypothetical protein A3B21_03290 [Candidatus Uhrbacteria bacterium RIFCSPLOWO2_01_FULL_47_24]|uniref:Uncharacterized protein n=1 Tax=Candidatus Uhrbacteria bacterium RIFCSPLOWO2_01_FULL_47_24 TaxID=1802401 RepID=A0A1F7UTB4_9BACT|nr:MAG: hypothetical protein A2753_05220 [Candidatus Uhrbacteria bacterium RIFCSPHIGHO2_01_FULL_47_11]OGL67610.1 MAG: hypothetical protein A3D58_03890 [Candidatus Uhrbacteria bacterium RIFCSPHIGHO2_02_FULL_46_47]OGL75799.1 MAG: hypothetical protein A3F52_05700 [Candidatus Uhrbacteria bacterium RIFCSPHIGHO2_12_FULL_47_11]OGL80964.1 MAG: hypothetical protein A3B21_03290 [Candidatus Uhrbacteria bacterium RIFCSPLOWO2_01_FULL_47_24]OGL84299.1 MAG: hypothetical protein A3J03_03290 [Candidatus Uhrbact
MTKPYSNDRGDGYEEQYVKEKLHDLDELKLDAYPKAMSALVALELKPATEVTVRANHDKIDTLTR